MLTEGSSIHSAERLTGTYWDTICRLLRVAGRKTKQILSRGFQLHWDALGDPLQSCDGGRDLPEAVERGNC